MFIGNLDVRLVKDQKHPVWQLLAPFSYQCKMTGKTYTVPIGFQTDFMTVPRMPLLYDELGDRGRMSGTVHDWLYSTHAEAREVCDSVLKEMLLIDGFTEVQAEECYLAVRVGGASHW